MKLAWDYIEETDEYVSRPATEFDGCDPQEASDYAVYSLDCV